MDLKIVDPKTITISDETQVVTALPYPIANRTHFHIEGNGVKRYTHSLFSFPAKFHVPVVKWSLSNFASPNDLILDPYNGSGTVQVEALASGYSSIGIDVDVVSSFIARVKTTPLDPSKLRSSFDRILKALTPYRRASSEYLERRFPINDISEDDFMLQTSTLWVPQIPNIMHWFRKYVIVDLAVLHKVISDVRLSAKERYFFLAIFAAIIRRCSNADSATISGLEYTKHMKERDAKGRLIDPFTFYEQKVLKEIDGMAHLWKVTQSHEDSVATIVAGDARKLTETLVHQLSTESPLVDLIITSPPYCNAVSYHTRNKLEAFWLKLVTTAEEYVKLYHGYTGRYRVLENERTIFSPFGIEVLDDAISAIHNKDRLRAISLHKYFSEMKDSIRQMAHVLRPGGYLLLFIGDSVSKGIEIATHDFIRTFTEEHLELLTEFSYNLPNRFMSYSRHNGANIKVEWGMVFTKPKV